MKRREVVSSFITIGNASNANLQKSILPKTQGDKFLLLKRSEKVRTFRHQWAVISGSIEKDDPNPLHRALQEIEEETSLKRDQVQLIRSAQPLRIPNNETNVEWVVYPFLFKLLVSADQIRIDWEHDESRWVSPEEFQQYKTVPNLASTFYRVYLPQNVHEGLVEMFNNRSSGAQQLADYALDILVDTISNKTLRPIIERLCDDKNSLIDNYMKQLVNIGYHIGRIRPTMQASIDFAITRCLQQFRDVIPHCQSIDDFESRMLHIIKEEKNRGKQSQQQINQHFLNLFSADMKHIHIVTLSYSSTISQALFTLIDYVLKNNLHLTITIMESRPLNEGANSLAIKLMDHISSLHSHVTKEQIEIVVITDASCGQFVQQATHVLLGVDRILGDDGTVINKIGSLPLALSAQYFKKNVYVISTSSKISSSGRCSDEEELEENSATEVFSSYEDSKKMV